MSELLFFVIGVVIGNIFMFVAMKNWVFELDEQNKEFRQRLIALGAAVDSDFDDYDSRPN